MAGIKYRHFSLEKHTGKLLDDSAGLGCKAAALALGRAGVDAKNLDLIITTTSTPPYLRPGLAKEIRMLLGNRGCSTYDLWGACTGIQQAITLATGGIRSGIFHNALLVGVELPSTMARAENYAPDKLTRYDLLLRGALGDGAGALVLIGSDRNEDQDGILYTCSGTEGTEESAFHREAGGSTFPLNARTFSEGLHHWDHDFEKLIKKGRPYFLEIVKRVLEAIGIPIEQVDFIVPAAANFGYFRADDYLAEIGPEGRAFFHEVASRIFTNFSDVGNVPSAAVYVALNELYERGRLNKDGVVLLPSVEGATWGWGASLLRWSG
jgi:3-oxoacyl-[acyl-carrier-protein] synthase III